MAKILRAIHEILTAKANPQPRDFIVIDIDLWNQLTEAYHTYLNNIEVE